jgi:vacuolar-type H+-ATPase catalytic subunit A/Vma1
MNKTKNILDEVYKEVRVAQRKHSPFNSSHESYAVIKEELEEYWEEVKKKSGDRDRENMRKELLQIAASAIKAIESMEIFN